MALTVRQHVKILPSRRCIFRAFDARESGADTLRTLQES